MTYQRDPNDPLARDPMTGEPVATRRPDMSTRRREESWGAFPAVIGVVFLLLVGLIAYNMYNNDTVPNPGSPSAQAPVTNPSGTTVTPKATAPATEPPAKAP